MLVKYSDQAYKFTSNIDARFKNLNSDRIDNVLDERYIEEFQKESYAILYYLPDEIKTKMVWRNEQDMTLLEYIEYGLFFCVGMDQLENPFTFDGKEKLKADIRTEEMVGVINMFLMWEENDSWIYEKAIKEYNDNESFRRMVVRAQNAAAEFGFSKDNPITLDWVVNYPDEAYVNSAARAITARRNSRSVPEREPHRAAWAAVGRASGEDNPPRPCVCN